MNAPEGTVNEKELQELTDVETPDGGTLVETTIAITVAVTGAFCPIIKSPKIQVVTLDLMMQRCIIKLYGCGNMKIVRYCII